MAPHVNDDLDLFYELIDTEIPDVETGQVLFAFYGISWDVQVTKIGSLMDPSNPFGSITTGYNITFSLEDEIVAEFATAFKSRALELCRELVEKYVSEGEDIDIAERYITTS